MYRIEAHGIPYKRLNEMLREAADRGEKEIELVGVNGQRYLGSGIRSRVKITIHGVPGNDLGSFLDGPEITVYADGQDAIGNTMNEGKIVVHGSAGDVIGYGMRGGKIHIRGHVGYRVGIHMKEYRRQVPVVIAGGTAGDFFGEYMAGGVAILLGLDCGPGERLTGDYLGTGMHGGVIYLRGEVDPSYLGQEVAVFDLEPQDEEALDKYLQEYCQDFALDYENVRRARFIKLVPVSSRPYGRLYAY
ncbi:MAG: hypothetical protein D9V47_11490 [Clostridia bacterium]|nr:MAG: hypothetical protein D9V47_11490 [Clostridia bacterium]